MNGDELARGASKASYNLNHGSNELEADLKLQTMEVVCSKYGIDETTYHAWVKLMEAKQPLPAVSLVPEKTSEPAQETIAESLSDLPEPETAQIGYKGVAFGNTVLVQTVEEKHTSRFILPDIQKSRSNIGFVKSVGDACKKRPKIGSLVLYDSYAATGREIELIDESGIARKLLLVTEDDILVNLKRINVGEEEKLSLWNKLKNVIG